MHPLFPCKREETFRTKLFSVFSSFQFATSFQYLPFLFLCSYPPLFELINFHRVTTSNGNSLADYNYLSRKRVYHISSKSLENNRTWLFMVTSVVKARDLCPECFRRGYLRINRFCVQCYAILNGNVFTGPIQPRNKLSKQRIQITLAYTYRITVTSSEIALEQYGNL